MRRSSVLALAAARKDDGKQGKREDEESLHGEVKYGLILVAVLPVPALARTTKALFTHLLQRGSDPRCSRRSSEQAIVVLASASWPGKKTFGDAQEQRFRLWTGFWCKVDADRLR
jgi:hypothetical protein